MFTVYCICVYIYVRIYNAGINIIILTDPIKPVHYLYELFFVNLVSCIKNCIKLSFIHMNSIYVCIYMAYTSIY